MLRLQSGAPADGRALAWRNRSLACGEWEARVSWEGGSGGVGGGGARPPLPLLLDLNDPAMTFALRPVTARTSNAAAEQATRAAAKSVALAAATVAAGKTPTPHLIAGTETLEAGDNPPVNPVTLDGVRSMMRQVVTDGTARDIDGLGEVYGKTGEAEFQGGSHAWFTGYRGDLAFAGLIVGGGSSTYAVRMVRHMMEGLPPDFLA
jgi:hypothetical protein